MASKNKSPKHSYWFDYAKAARLLQEVRWARFPDRTIKFCCQFMKGKTKYNWTESALSEFEKHKYNNPSFDRILDLCMFYKVDIPAFVTSCLKEGGE